MSVSCTALQNNTGEVCLASEQTGEQIPRTTRCFWTFITLGLVFNRSLLVNDLVNLAQLSFMYEAGAQVELTFNNPA